MLVRQAGQRRIGLCSIGHRMLSKIWVGAFLVRGIRTKGMILNWFCR